MLDSNSLPDTKDTFRVRKKILAKETSHCPNGLQFSNGSSLICLYFKQSVTEPMIKNVVQIQGGGEESGLKWVGILMLVGNTK